MTGEEPKRFCRKCLLIDMPEDEYFRDLRSYIERIEESLKVSSEIYKSRLDKCRECEQLISGMCRICGCFVELRAVMRKNSCPAVHPMWEKEPAVTAWQEDY